MIIDNKGKLFGKVSIIDILIVLVILAAAFGAYKYVAKKSGITFTSGNQSNIQIQFFAEEIPNYAAKSIEEGVGTKDFDRNTNFGTVKKVELDKALSFGIASNGQYARTSKPEYMSAKLTVEGKGVFGSTGVTIDNFEYNIGKTITLKAGNSTFSCRISDIKKKE